VHPSGYTQAAQIVFDFPLPVELVPLNVTHTALFDDQVRATLLSTPTPLRTTLVNLLTFFRDTYRDVFGFVAPPVHDALAVARVTHPHLFKGKRYRVDVELHGTHTAGTTIVDVWDHTKADDTHWGPGSKNVWIAEEVEVRIHAIYLKNADVF
jgi:uridine nucleosidase